MFIFVFYNVISHLFASHVIILKVLNCSIVNDISYKVLYSDAITRLLKRFASMFLWICRVFAKVKSRSAHMKSHRMAENEKNKMKQNNNVDISVNSIQGSPFRWVPPVLNDSWCFNQKVTYWTWQSTTTN